MPAWKLAIALVVIACVALVGWAYVSPNSAPGPLRKWGLALNGVSPAKTPREALDKFMNQVSNRNYEYAKLYLTGPYAEEFRVGAPYATKLAKAIDDLNHNIKQAEINSEKSTLVLGLLEPMPGDIKIKETPKEDGDKDTTATLEFLVSGKPASVLSFTDKWNVDPRIFMTLMPPNWNGRVLLKKDAEGWRIDFGLTEPQLQVLREKIKTLKDDHGNYVRAMENLKYDIKHNAATKADVENQLKKQLEEARGK